VLNSSIGAEMLVAITLIIFKSSAGAIYFPNHKIQTNICRQMQFYKRSKTRYTHARMFSSYDVTVDLKYNLQLVMIAILNKRKRQNHVAMQKFVKKGISFLSRMMNWLLYLLPKLKLIKQFVCLLKDKCDNT
jgi:hypothetical protein